MIKVIISDDEEKVCTLIRNLVDWQQFDMEIVGVAHNGEEALDLIGHLLPDLIITDIRMPGCDGLELIRRAKQLQNDLSFIIISGHRHFEYAQTAIKFGVSDYLLKPIKKDELESTLQKMHRLYQIKNRRLSEEEKNRIQRLRDENKLRSGYFQNVILGNEPAEQNPVLLNAHYHFSFRPGVYQSFLIKIDSRQPFGAQGLQVLTAKTVEILQRLRPDCIDMQFFSKGSRVYGILNYDDGKEASLEKTFRLIMNELSDQKSAFVDTEFTVCMGSRRRSPAELKSSMNDALDSMGQRLISFCGRIILFENVTGRERYDERLLADLNRSMALSLEILDEDKMRAAVAVFESGLTGTPGISGRAIFEAICAAYDRFVILLQNMQFIRAAGSLTADFFDQADLCRSTVDLFAFFEERTVGHLKSFAESRERDEQRPIFLAKDFILKNYASPITLEQVSELAGFNPSYFSTLFKKKCGMNFLEYLSDVRISKAKELLRTSDDSVAKICEAVGYLDLKHFTRIFKKSTGVTPAEFRKLYS